MYEIENPYDVREREKEERFERLPDCTKCGYKIQDEYSYQTEEGEMICKDCFEDLYGGETDEGHICPCCGRSLTWDIGCFNIDGNTHCRDYVNRWYRKEIEDD